MRRLRHELRPSPDGERVGPGGLLRAGGIAVETSGPALVSGQRPRVSRFDQVLEQPVVAEAVVGEA